MTRDEIKKLFPEATDEQVSALLSSHHSEIGFAKALRVNASTSLIRMRSSVRL